MEAIKLKMKPEVRDGTLDEFMRKFFSLGVSDITPRGLYDTISRIMGLIQGPLGISAKPKVWGAK